MRPVLKGTWGAEAGWDGASWGRGVEGKRWVLQGQNLDHMETGPSFPSGAPRSIGECVHLDGWTP